MGEQHIHEDDRAHRQRPKQDRPPKIEALDDHASDPRVVRLQRRSSDEYTHGVEDRPTPSLIQRAPSGQPVGLDPAATFDAATRGAGQAVPHQAEMERAFDTDFGDVKAHVGQGIQMKALGARAAARGNEVAFATPHPDRGLVAHELAHVVQQRQTIDPGPKKKGHVGAPDDPAEREADRAAQDVLAGRPAQVGGDRAGGVRLERAPEPAAGGQAAIAAADRFAAQLLEAFKGMGTDEQAIYRALNQPPEVVGQIVGRYNARYNQHTGDGLVADLKSELGEEDLDFAMGQLARAGLGAGEARVSYKRQEDQKGANDTRIVAKPAVPIAVPGTKVTYRIEQGPQMYATGSYYSFSWYCLNDPISSKNLGAVARYDGPTEAVWESAEWDFVGCHKVICRLQFHPAGGKAHKPELIEYVQTVAPATAVTHEAFQQAARPDDPGQVLAGADAYLKLLLAAEKQEGSSKLDPKQKEQLEAYVGAMKERLASTEGKQRIPIKAVHLDIEQARKTTLNAFVAKTGQEGEVQIWQLVDITNPSDRRLTSVNEGRGRTAEAAITAAVADWDSRNRYPTGLLELEIPAEATGTSRPHHTRFSTDGQSFWDSIGEFFSTVGLVAGVAAIAAGVITAIAPVPGSRVVSGAIWGAILTSATASTAAAVISMGQRRSEGFVDLKADAFDILTIAGNITGVGGVLWSRGATVVMSGVGKSSMARAFIIASVGTDAAQGVLMSTDYLVQFNEVMQISDPKRRTDMLLELLGSAAVNGALIAISIRGAKADLAGLDPNKVKLARLADSGETIDLAAGRPRLDAPAPRARADTGGANPLKMNLDDLLADSAAQQRLHQQVKQALDEITGKLHRLDGDGVEILAGMKRSKLDDFIASVKEKVGRKGYKEIGDMGDMVRGRISCADGDQMKAIVAKLQKAFPDAEFDFKEGMAYPRVHVDIKAHNGVRFELQVGTQATNKFIETDSVRLPKPLADKVGLEVVNFHVAKYDILDKLPADARSKYGLDALFKRYDEVLAQTGTGKLDPKVYKKLNDNLEEVFRRLAKEDPELLASLYTKGPHGGTQATGTHAAAGAQAPRVDTGGNPLDMNLDQLLDNPAAQQRLHQQAKQALDQINGTLGKLDADGVEILAGMKRSKLDDFIASVKEKVERKGYKRIGDMGDMIRGRISCADGEQMKDVIARLQKDFPDADFDFKEGMAYPRVHIDIKAHNGVRFELQVGTQATNKFIETNSVRLPKALADKVGLEVVNFHVAKYDILDKLPADARSKYGLDGLFARYDKVLADTGTGKLDPKVYQELNDGLEGVLRKLAEEDPALLASLYTKGPHG